MILNCLILNFVVAVVGWSLSCVQFFATPWTIACQDSLSSTIFQILLKFKSILFFTTLNFTFTTRHFHSFTSLLLWPRHLILLGSCSGPQLFMALCDPMNCSMPGFPALHHLLEYAQTHVHWIGDDIQTSHSLSSHSPPAFNLSQHKGLFQWISSPH